MKYKIVFGLCYSDEGGISHVKQTLEYRWEDFDVAKRNLDNMREQAEIFKEYFMESYFSNKPYEIPDPSNDWMVVHLNDPMRNLMNYINLEMDDGGNVVHRIPYLGSEWGVTLDYIRIEEDRDDWEYIF